MVNSYNFPIRNTNSHIIFIDNSKRVSTEFKNKLMKLIIKILESEEVVFHLKNINIYFDDTLMRLSSLEKMYREGRAPPHPAYEVNRKGIVLNVDEWFYYYYFRGIVPLYKFLKSALTHELIHYLHYSINKNLRKIWMAHLRLRERYKKDYKEFKKLLDPDILEYLNLFIMKCVSEGFATFFDKLKHEKITFTKESFQEYYNKAIESAMKLNKEFDKFKKINKRNLKKFRDFWLFNVMGGSIQPYIIGFHIIYSIIYLYPETLEKDINSLLRKFKSSFGRLKPRKLIDFYEDLMRKNNLEPVLSFKHSGGYINCREVSRTWKRIFES